VMSPTVVGVRAQYSVEFQGGVGTTSPSTCIENLFFYSVTIGNTVSVSKSEVETT